MAMERIIKCWCGVRWWVILISWFQTVFCGSLLLFLEVTFIWPPGWFREKQGFTDSFSSTTSTTYSVIDGSYSSTFQSLSPEDRKLGELARIFATFLSISRHSLSWPLVLGFISGIVFTVGIMQRNENTVKTWFILKIIFALVTLLQFSVRFVVDSSISSSDSSGEWLILGALLVTDSVLMLVTYRNPNALFESSANARNVDYVRVVV